MQDAIALAVIAATWIYGWHVGRLWVRGCGVRGRAAVWCLACIIPTASLIAAVHAMGFVGLFSGRGVVSPITVAITFILVCWAARFFVATELPPSTRMLRPGLGPPAPLRMGWWWLPVIVVGGMYLVFFVDAATGYPTGHDTLFYHLPSAVRWMQQQSLNPLPGVASDCLHENGMIVPFLLAFAKLERLFPLVHLPKALVVAATVFALARFIEVRPLPAVIAAVIALSVPMVVFQSFSGYVDLYATASWLSALLAIAWAMRATTARQRRNLILLAGLSAGVALGARTSFLVVTALLAAVLAAEMWFRPHEGRTHAPAPVRNVAWFGVGLLVCTTFWFTRATMHTGNPIYPIEVKVAGTTLLPGYDMNARFPQRSLGLRLQRWWDYPWHEAKYSGSGENPGYPYSRNNAMGAAYAAFVPLGCLALLFGSFNGRPRTQEEKWQIVFLLIAATAVVLVPTVFKEVLRYALPQILLAIVVAAVLLDRLITRFPQAMLATATIALVVTATIAAVKPAHALAGRIRDGRWDRAWFYQVPGVIDDLPPGARVLNLAAPSATYSLLGGNLSNQVITHPEWETLTGMRVPNTMDLQRLGIQYVFVQEPWPTDWPAGLPVRVIFDNSESRAVATSPAARIYRVEPVGYAGQNRNAVLTAR
ncbi:MAG: hypothetical protein JXB13_03205 [Phycisphaerae bacterium]|nr:hypothetical protein [Phycisphaerae bacterium]